MGGCIYNKCNILPIIQNKSINKDLLSGFILPAVTTDAVWFTVGSFVCLLSPVNTIVTRWVHVSRVSALHVSHVSRSVISRAVSEDEIGRIYSVLALFSAVSVTVTCPSVTRVTRVQVSGSLVEAAFQQLYSATRGTLQGGVYLLVLAGLLLVTVPSNIMLRKWSKAL